MHHLIKLVILKSDKPSTIHVICTESAHFGSMTEFLKSDKSYLRSPLKSRFLPLSILLICLSWIHFNHVYIPPQNTSTPWIILGFAFVLILIRIISRSNEPWTEKLIRPTWAAWLGLIACILLFVLYPAPYNYGALPLGVGWIFLSRFGRQTIGGYCVAALVQIGLLLLISASLLPLIYFWSASVHELSGPAYFFTIALNWLLNLLGQATDFIDGSIYLRTFENLYPQTITSEKLLPIPLLLFTVLWSTIIFLKSQGHRFERLIFFWIVIFIYALFRIAVLILIMIQQTNPYYFWDPLWMTLSLLPLGLIVSEPRDLSTLNQYGRKKMRRLGNSCQGFVLGLIFGSAVLAFMVFRDPGVQKNGIVLINEHGSDWEWTYEPMDSVTFNEKTTYNYYCMAEFIKYYYDVSTNFEPLSSEILEQIDVLILKVPTEPYAQQEIDAVVEFVEQGGGLWVIGDHTNVFGSSSFLNPLLSRFKCRLRYDSTHDLQTGNLSVYQKPPIFAHPSVINLPPYLFATSCSVTAPFNAAAAILGYGLRTDHLDYSQKNFFPDRSRNLFDIGFGLFIQQVAVKQGKGRLLIYSDSTTFSNFFIFLRGKPELVLGSLNWLNRENHFAWINYFALLLALVCLTLIFLLRSWDGGTLAGVLLGVAISGWALDRAAHLSYPLPEPQRQVPWLNFEREYSDYFLPTLRLVNESDKSSLTFYVWTQRVGAIPREMYSFDEAISSGDPVVMIDPASSLDEASAAALVNYVEDGGRLLLLNSADNPSVAALQIARQFDLNLITVPSQSDTLHTLTLERRYFPLRIGGKFSYIEGGETILKSDQGDPLIAFTNRGQGGIWVVAAGHLFRNNSMGQTTIVPDEGLKALYRIEFELIRELLGPVPQNQ